MRGRAFSVGSEWGWEDAIPFGTGKPVLNVRTEDGCPALMAVMIAPVRSAENIATAANESAAEATVEWGSGQGVGQTALVDVGCGTVFTVPASELRVILKNIGGWQQEGTPPTRKWRATCDLGTAQSLPALRALRFINITSAAESAAQFVPAFARKFSFPRYPQVPCRVRFYNGAGLVFAEHRFQVDEDRLLDVPVGADRVTVLVDDPFQPLFRGQVQFELSF